MQVACITILYLLDKPFKLHTDNTSLQLLHQQQHLNHHTEYILPYAVLAADKAVLGTSNRKVNLINAASR
jgi:hypothetical protein